VVNHKRAERLYRKDQQASDSVDAIDWVACPVPRQEVTSLPTPSYGVSMASPNPSLLLLPAVLGALGCGDLINEPHPAAEVVLMTTLETPKQLIASALSRSEARLSWLDASTSESGFEILRSTTGAGGPYALVRTVASNVVTFKNTGLSANRTYCYQVRAKAGGGLETSAASNSACITTMVGTSPAVRVITFGDSNTDWGLDGTNPTVLATSYVGHTSSSAAMLPNTSDQLAGKVEIRWKALRSNAVRAVNHGISGTTTGGGGFGGPDRDGTGAPEARTLVSGITRFEGEVLGAAWPWSGGEPLNMAYPDGALRRVQAFVPEGKDFVYVSMGTNDPLNGISHQQTLANLRWMIDTWQAAGRRSDHFLLTTLAPRTDFAGNFPALNDGIRALAAAEGVVLIDLASHTSDDNGLTWRSSDLHVGDGVHYSESVRDWLADRIVAEVSARVSNGRVPDLHVSDD